MIHTMTDETYAVNLTLESEGKEKEYKDVYEIEIQSQCKKKNIAALRAA